MKAIWQYGTLGTIDARRLRSTGVIEIRLRKAGQDGRKEDFWHIAGAGHESEFKTPDETMLAVQSALLRKRAKV